MAIIKVFTQNTQTSSGSEKLGSPFFINQTIDSSEDVFDESITK